MRRPDVRRPNHLSPYRRFKSAVTKQLHRTHHFSGAPIWQRNDYEYVVRDENALNRIREYIINDPLCRAPDRENPHRHGVDDSDVWLNHQGRIGL